MHCAVIISIAPGHEALAEETAFSVQFAFETDPGPFSDVFIIRIDNAGSMDPTEILHHGARLADEQGIEWLCFLNDADILYPYAFQYLARHVENRDAIFGLITEQLPGNLGIREQQPQIRKMDRLEDFIFHHPALTLCDSHFVRTQTAISIGSKVLTDDSFSYHLRLWHHYRCSKIDQTLAVKRPGKTAVHADASSATAHKRLLNAYVALLDNESAGETDIEALKQKLFQFQQQGLLDQAASIHKLILRYDAQHSAEHADRGNNISYDLERYTTAFGALDMPPDTDFQQALQLHQQGQLTQAAGICKAVLLQTPAHTEALHLLGLMHCNIGYRSLGVEILRTAIEINPRNHQLWNNLGVSELGIPRHADALDSFDRALILEIGYAPAWHGRAVALKELGRHEEAVAGFNRALELDPENAETLSNRGITLRELQRFDEALVSFEQASFIDPDYPFLQGNILYCRQLMCHWQGFNALEKRVLQDVDDGKTVCTPFQFLAIASNLRQQRQCVERYAVTKPQAKSSCPTNPAHEKIRLGYFSANFQTHAVSYLTAELFELHDRSRFEVIAFSYGPPAQDAIRHRLEQGFDRFINIWGFSDQQVVALAHELEIDIAIDLSGHTRDSRLALFAQRIAPIQCHYLGYPGTLGATYIDYLIADPVVVSHEHQEHYAEKIARLPYSFMVSDRQRAIDKKVQRRSEFGLPETAFVFCCFNNSYKITPQTFDIWMSILHQIDDSVLWLSRGNAWSIANIHREAAQRGVEPKRIVFATHVERADQHLARHQLADLFLDTFSYGAHTTANDALWAGLPVLTCQGETFAGRVAASLLSSLELPELITHSQEEYQARAIELAGQPQQLRAVRSKLAAKRTTAPLFDTPRFTRQLEQLYTQMRRRRLAGLAPEHIDYEER
jgi:protein O-GlcNAc transferase